MIKLLEMRTKRNMSQSELAKACGVSQQEISNIESGLRNNPRILTLLKLSKTLRCSIYDLIEEEKKDA